MGRLKAKLRRAQSHKNCGPSGRRSWPKEWQWNNDGFTLKLSRDGDIDAPIQQCLGVTGCFSKLGGRGGGGGNAHSEFAQEKTKEGDGHLVLQTPSLAPIQNRGLAEESGDSSEALFFFWAD